MNDKSLAQFGWFWEIKNWQTQSIWISGSEFDSFEWKSVKPDSLIVLNEKVGSSDNWITLISKNGYCIALRINT